MLAEAAGPTAGFTDAAIGAAAAGGPLAANRVAAPPGSVFAAGLNRKPVELVAAAGHEVTPAATKVAALPGGTADVATGMKELLADDGWLSSRDGGTAGAALVATGAAVLAAAARPANEGRDVAENWTGPWAAVEATGGVGLGAVMKVEAPPPPKPPNEKTLLAVEANENAAPAEEAGADANSEGGAALLAEGAVVPADVATGMNELPAADAWLENEGAAAVCIGLRWPSDSRSSGGRTRDGAPWARFFM